MLNCETFEWQSLENLIDTKTRWKNEERGWKKHVSDHLNSSHSMNIVVDILVIRERAACNAHEPAAQFNSHSNNYFIFTVSSTARRKSSKHVVDLFHFRLNIFENLSKFQNQIKFNHFEKLLIRSLRDCWLVRFGGTCRSHQVICYRVNLKFFQAEISYLNWFFLQMNMCDMNLAEIMKTVYFAEQVLISI